MSDAEEFTFACPECGETMEVNAPMMDALVDHGCVVCGTSLSESAFSRV